MDELVTVAISNAPTVAALLWLLWRGDRRMDEMLQVQLALVQALVDFYRNPPTPPHTPPTQKDTPPELSGGVG